MNSSESDKSLREHMLSLLRGRNAHLSFEDFIKDFPIEKCGEQIDNLPYTAWQVLEHMRIAQWDILEFCRDVNHTSPKWPEGYWPPADQLGNAERWNETVEKFRKDLDQMNELVDDARTDLFAKIPHGNDQTILREALLIADHNSYHLGALAVMNPMLGK